MSDGIHANLELHPLAVGMTYKENRYDEINQLPTTGTSGN